MAVSNQLSNQPRRQGITSFLSSPAVKNQIMDVVGGKDGQKFISSVVSAVNNNPALAECTNSSIFSAALLGQSLKLSPSPQLGQFYMVPFNDKNKGKVAQFQLGYKGYIQLALRSGYYKKLNVLAIKQGELIRYNPLEEEIEVNLIEDEEQREQTPTIGYYAFFEYMNGFRKTMYWSRAKMESHALRYSKGYAAKKGYTFWEKDFDGMAYKTMLRQLISKWGIMSIEMQTALENDLAVIKDDGTPEYVENDMIIDATATEVSSEPDTVPAPVVKPTAEEHATATTSAPQRKNGAAAALFGGK